MHYRGRWTGIGRHASVISRIRDERLRNKQLAGRSGLGPLGFQTYAAPGGVEVDYGVAVVPGHGRWWCGMDVHCAGQRYCASLLHVHLARPGNCGLSVCKEQEISSEAPPYLAGFARIGHDKDAKLHAPVNHFNLMRLKF